jgi:hypothetical protein
MDDPALPRLLAAIQDDLNVQKIDRQHIRALGHPECASGEDDEC